MEKDRSTTPLGVEDAVEQGGMRLSLRIVGDADDAAREEFLTFFASESQVLTGLAAAPFAALTDFLAGELTAEEAMPTGTAATLEALNTTYLRDVVSECKALGAEAVPLGERVFLAVPDQGGLYCYIAGKRFCYEFFAISSEDGVTPLTYTASNGDAVATLGVTCSGFVER